MLVLGSEVRTVMETHVVEMAAINELASSWRLSAPWDL